MFRNADLPQRKGSFSDAKAATAKAATVNVDVPCFNYINDSPYEHLYYNAEYGEDLFEKVALLFGSLQVRQGPEKFAQVKEAFARFGVVVSGAMIEDASKANELLETEEPWMDGWMSKFCSNQSSNKFPASLLLLMIKPGKFATATVSQLDEILSLPLCPLKQLFEYFDPGQEFELLHRSPESATRTLPTRKAAIFLYRTYLGMKVLGWKSLNNAPASLHSSSFPRRESLLQKTQECLRILDTSARSYTPGSKEAKQAESSSSSSSVVVLPKRGPGRPRKHPLPPKPTSAAAMAEESLAKRGPGPKKRGRPRKNHETPQQQQPPKKRGRPSKRNVLPAAVELQSVVVANENLSVVSPQKESAAASAFIGTSKDSLSNDLASESVAKKTSTVHENNASRSKVPLNDAEMSAAAKSGAIFEQLFLDDANPTEEEEDCDDDPTSDYSDQGSARKKQKSPARKKKPSLQKVSNDAPETSLAAKNRATAEEIVDDDPTSDYSDPESAHVKQPPPTRKKKPSLKKVSNDAPETSLAAKNGATAKDDHTSDCSDPESATANKEQPPPARKKKPSLKKVSNDASQTVLAGETGVTAEEIKDNDAREMDCAVRFLRDLNAQKQVIEQQLEENRSKVLQIQQESSKLEQKKKEIAGKLKKLGAAAGFQSK